MYEQFTDRSRHVMQLANSEAQRFRHDCIGTEHMLMGLLKDGGGVAPLALKNLDLDLGRISVEVEDRMKAGPRPIIIKWLPLTPLAKSALEFATNQADEISQGYVCTEHILLGLLQAQDGLAAQVLTDLGLTFEGVRREVFRIYGRQP